MATFRDLVPPIRPEADNEEAHVARHSARRGETVEEAVARGVRIEIWPILERSKEHRSGQWTSGDFQVVKKPASKPVRPPSRKRLARSSAKRVDEE